MAFGNRFGKREKGKKYNNTKVEYNGIKFDSKKEMQRYLVLKTAEENGLISNLQLQVRFELIPAVKEEYIEHLKTKDKIKTKTVQLPITYTCDFMYDKEGETIVEDVKASPKIASLDKSFILKEKLFRWKFGFSIKRIYKPNDEI